jgi:integral membrane protein (TIGR00529 family)
MADILKISLVFILILLLIRKKLNIGLVMLIAASVLSLLYRMALPSIWETCKSAILNDVTIKLILALSFIRIFEMILREHAVLTRMTAAVKAIFKNRKIVIISMPLLIGLMPSIGGAYFSAPMVAETTGDTNMSPEEKGFINYWYRHPWEFILPLYPGILLASAIAQVELYNLIMVNAVYAALVIISGFIFAMHGIKGMVKTEERLHRKDLWSFAPILTALLLVVIFHVELHYALLAIVISLLIFYRYNLKSTLTAIKYGFSLDVIVLIIGIMIFKEAMDHSGAVNNLSRYFIQEGIPVLPILFLLPFITGLLTGVTVGFVGATFPLIISLTENISLVALSFAFASGYLGVLLSPVHVCLLLTREYFKADFWGMYKLIIPACITIFCGAIVMYFMLN